MKTWAVSDYHINHENVIKYDSRPFLCKEEMGRVILERANEKVKAEDRFLYLGDLAFGTNKIDTVKQFLTGLTCKNVWYVRGNHDGECFYATDGKRVEKGWSYQYKEELLKDGWLKCLEDVLHVKWTRPHLWLSHYAHRTWPDQSRGTVHLFGHSHQNLVDDVHALSMDVGCNGNEYYPYDVEVEVKAWMELKSPRKLDHH